MRNGEHRPPDGRAAERLQHPRFRFRVKVRCDLVKQKHGGIGRRRAGDAEQLPFALRKQTIRPT